MLQQEEDEEDEYVTTKQVSAARYHRNQKLMAELFGDAVVPDMRVSVTNSRLESLKMQSNSLALHQKRLQTEVEQMEIKYGEKRAQILEEAERFRRELKRIQENPPITWKKPPVQLSPKDIPESLPSAKYTKL
jgi:SWI/SNF-related matrix-associated actin-dependent regulator of chromatin subfamily E protein 1